MMWEYVWEWDYFQLVEEFMREDDSHRWKWRTQGVCEVWAEAKDWVSDGVNERIVSVGRTLVGILWDKSAC